MYMLIPWIFEYLETMYMLILLGFWMLVNYVYVDSNGFYNACKLCILLIPIDFIIWEYLQTMYMLIPMDFIILGNYVYVDSNEFMNGCKLCTCWLHGFLNACKLCICWFQWILLILGNYVYVDSTGFHECL